MFKIQKSKYEAVGNVLEYCKKNPGAKVTVITNFTGLNPGKTRRILESLLKAGFLSSVGDLYGREYTITPKGKIMLDNIAWIRQNLEA